MKKVLLTLFIFGAFQGFSQQTVNKERVVRPTVQPAPSGERPQAQPASTPQPAATGTGNEQPAGVQSTTTPAQPRKKTVAKSAVLQQRAPAKANP